MKNLIFDWFEDYVSFAKDSERNFIEKDKVNFNSLLHNLKTITEDVKLRESTVASNYNIFGILKYIAAKEEITHSPFLSDLLNIHGRHNQGHLFYNGFLEVIGGYEMIKKFRPENEMFISCQLEKWVGDGAIDIFIEYNSPNRKFALAFENKIFATDQPKQLERYYRYLQYFFEDNFLLLYLTPDGKLPSMPDSIEENLYYDLLKKGLIKNISFRYHIVTMLQNSLPNIKAQKVRFTVEQYLEIIKRNFRYD